MFSNTFKWINSIPRITKLLAPTNVDVRYSGDAAYTMVNQNTNKIELINLPTLSEPVSEDAINLTFGYMFHELGHVYNTDFNVAKTNNLNMSSPLGMIFNIIEDTYVEREISGRFLEASRYLVRCRQFIIDYSQKSSVLPLNKDEKIANMVVPYIRYYAGQHEFQEIMDKCKTPKLDFIAKFEQELKSIKNTKESLEVAKKIYDVLKKEMNFNNIQQNQQNGQGGQEGQQHSGNGGQGSENSNQEQQGGSQSTQDNGSGQNNQSGGSAENNFKNALKKAIEESDMFKQIRAKGTKDAIANGGNSGTPIGCAEILKTENDNRYCVLSREDDEFFEMPSHYSESVKDKLSPNVNIAQMQAKLIRLFAAKNRKLFVAGKRKGKLCGANLHRLTLEDDRVFKQKIEHKSINTAITLLVDLSGSMSGGKDRCAISAAYLFANILDRLKIPCEVLGFSTGDMKTHNIPQEICDDRCEYRTEAVKIGIFKSFGERLTTNVLGRFCHFYSGNNDRRYYNCNDDGESILMALTRLAARTEQRKMIFVLSDGMPNVSGCCGSEIRHLKNVVKEIEREKNYEIYGIGIQTSAVKKFYSNYSVLDKPEDLSKVIIEQLSKNIL